MAETKPLSNSAADWHQLAVSAARAKNYEAALDLMRRAVEANPDDAIVFNDRGIVLKALGRFDESRASFERALALSPRYAIAHSNLGNLLREMRQWEAAYSSYQQSLRADPACTDAHANLGVLLSDMARWGESVDQFDQALLQKPGDAHVLCNRGVALERLGNLREALDSYDGALQSRPGFARVLANRGNVLLQLRQLQTALQSCERAILLEPQLAAAHQNRGLVLLTLGRLAEGWREYEWRLKDGAGAAAPAREFKAPRFTGIEELDGRTIFVHSEQGLGDSLQFARYALQLSSRGAKVILEVPAPLRALFDCLEGVTSIARGEPVPQFDLHCPLMSLPLAFNTTLESIPAQVPYLRADPQRVQEWGSRLGEKGRPRVGLVWSGGFRPKQPEVWAVDRRRNLPFKQLEVLKDAPVDFISLQKGEPAEGELKAWQSAGWNGPRILNVAEHLNDFADTAALVAHLDLVISVDTSTAHLAGAMAKPVWILSRFDACWRWLEERTDSPWYPTATLYRQLTPGAWDQLMQRVALDLKAFA